jgi:hypothetical protein
VIEHCLARSAPTLQALAASPRRASKEKYGGGGRRGSGAGSFPLGDYDLNWLTRQLGA